MLGVMTAAPPHSRVHAHSVDQIIIRRDTLPVCADGLLVLDLKDCGVGSARASRGTYRPGTVGKSGGAAVSIARAIAENSWSQAKQFIGITVDLNSTRPKVAEKNHARERIYFPNDPCRRTNPSLGWTAEDGGPHMSSFDVGSALWRNHQAKRKGVPFSTPLLASVFTSLWFFISTCQHWYDTRLKRN